MPLQHDHKQTQSPPLQHNPNWPQPLLAHHAHRQAQPSPSESSHKQTQPSPSEGNHNHPNHHIKITAKPNCHHHNTITTSPSHDYHNWSQPSLPHGHSPTQPLPSQRPQPPPSQCDHSQNPPSCAHNQLSQHDRSKTRLYPWLLDLQSPRLLPSPTVSTCTQPLCTNMSPQTITNHSSRGATRYCTAWHNCSHQDPANTQLTRKPHGRHVA